MKHGTTWAYGRGCSCDPCKAANAERMRGVRARNADKYVASAHVCVVCGGAVWQTAPGRKYRHAVRADHDPVPALREHVQGASS